MKKYPKLVQCDSRGQLVIPKDVRAELGIDEGTGFWVYSVENEGILLKKIADNDLEGSGMLKKIDEKAEKLKLSKKNIRATVRKYKKTRSGNLEVIS